MRVAGDEEVALLCMISTLSGSVLCFVYLDFFKIKKR